MAEEGTGRSGLWSNPREQALAVPWRPARHRASRERHQLTRDLGPTRGRAILVLLVRLLIPRFDRRRETDATTAASASIVSPLPSDSGCASSGTLKPMTGST